MRTKTTIYVKNGDLATYRSFQKVCHREGVSVSEKVMKMIYNYMATHGEGNPQTLLEYAGEFKTLPRWKTCMHSQKTRVQGEIFCNPGIKGYPPFWRVTAACVSCEEYRPEEEDPIEAR